MRSTLRCAPLLLVLAVVIATTMAGIVFEVMKDRTRSLVAPGLAHWATNGLSLLVVWFTVGSA